MKATMSGGAAGLTEEDGFRRLTDTARQVADTVANAASEASARLPEAASTTRDAFQEANRMVRSGSDETLKVVGALSLGFAGGLLIGGASRLLVIAALVPAALVGSEFVERRNTPAR